LIDSGRVVIRAILSATALFCSFSNAFSDEPQKDYSDLYTALQVRGEPSLLEHCIGDYEALRVFEFSDAGPLGIVRIERLDDALVHTFRCYDGDRQSQTHKRLVEEKDWRKVLELLESGGYTNTESAPQLWVPSGRTWLFETCLAGRYESMRAYPDRDRRMQDVVNAMIDLNF
jgi:hypothetical protein